MSRFQPTVVSIVATFIFTLYNKLQVYIVLRFCKNNMDLLLKMTHGLAVNRLVSRLIGKIDPDFLFGKA